jgi:hypothetical protein
MEPVRSPIGVFGSSRVQERAAGGGGKKDAEAFRRALEQETRDLPQEQRAAGAETPLRTRLQPQAAASRRADGATPRHVDVIA